MKQSTKKKKWKIDTDRESALILRQVMRQLHIRNVYYFVQGEVTSLTEK